MSKSLPLLLLVLAAMLPPKSTAQQPEAAPATLQRHYVEGTISHYRMTGKNDDREYSLSATDVVKRDATGHYYEEISWSDLTSNTQQSLNPASLALKQTVSLDDPADYMKMPNLAVVQPLLIGPITDTLTFYTDLLRAIRANLAQPGQSAYVPSTKPNSWADGHYVLVGQDVVDFSLKVEAVNQQEHTETLFIQHVPPPALHINLPAPWMRESAPVGPKNFVQVSTQGDEFFTETGKETFDVRIVVDTRDGHILSASMHNPVSLTTRICTDRDLTKCGPEAPKTILREITWKLVP